MSLLLLLWHEHVYAQNNIKVQGCVFNDSSRSGINNVNISITGVTSGRLLYQGSNVEHGNCFAIKIDAQGEDSILLEASHIAYIPYLKRFAVADAQQLNMLNIFLERDERMLPGVEVLPPSWRKDDTTYYRVDAYKEGEERTLADLFGKLPDFKIENDGRLTYKGKEIKKMTLNGNEVFADRIQTLLQNVPLHVLDVVEARENQPGNKLTAGLQRGNETEINLTLKKNTDLRLFGQTGVEAGTLKRYAVNGTAFSLVPQFNAGLIGNFNNMGRFTGYFSQDYSARNSWHNSRNVWMSNEPSITRIFNFDDARYIKNIENILQFEQKIPLSKKLTQKMELAFFENRQRQQTNQASTFLTSSDIISRIDTNNILLGNRFYLVKNNFTYRPSDSKELLINTEYNYEQLNNRSAQHVIQNGSSNQLADTSRSYVHSAIVNSNFTHRVNSSTALIYSADFAFSAINRRSVSFGQNYNLPLDEPVVGNVLSVEPQIELYKLVTGLKLVKRTARGRIIAPELVYESWYARFVNATSISDYNHGGAVNAISLLSQPGANSSSRYLYGRGAYSWSLGKPSRTLGVNVSMGAAQQTYHLQAGIKKYFPFVDASVEYGHRDVEVRPFLQSAMLRVENKLPVFNQLQPFFMPRSIRNFNAGGPAVEPAWQLSGSVGLFNVKSKSGNSGLLSLYYNYIEKSQVTEVSYLSLIQLVQTSMINKPSYNGGLTFRHKFVSMALSSLIEASITASASKRYVLAQNTVNATNSYDYMAELSIKRNWNKKYYIRLYDRASASIFKRSGLPVEGVSSRPVNNQFTFWQRLVIHKSADAQLSADWYQNNLFTPNRQSFFYMEFKSNWNISERWNIGMTVMNLFNAEGYSSVFNTAYSQSFYYTPLLPRNLSASIKWKF